MGGGGVGAQPDCTSDGLVPGRVAGEEAGGCRGVSLNRIHSHTADHGTGGSRERDDGDEKELSELQQLVNRPPRTIPVSLTFGGVIFNNLQSLQ